MIQRLPAYGYRRDKKGNSRLHSYFILPYKSELIQGVASVCPQPCLLSLLPEGDQLLRSQGKMGDQEGPPHLPKLPHTPPVAYLTLGETHIGIQPFLLFFDFVCMFWDISAA